MGVKIIFRWLQAKKNLVNQPFCCKYTMKMNFPETLQRHIVKDRTRNKTKIFLGKSNDVKNYLSLKGLKSLDKLWTKYYHSHGNTIALCSPNIHHRYHNSSDPSPIEGLLPKDTLICFKSVPPASRNLMQTDSVFTKKYSSPLSLPSLYADLIPLHPTLPI